MVKEDHPWWGGGRDLRMVMWAGAKFDDEDGHGFDSDAVIGGEGNPEEALEVRFLKWVLQNRMLQAGSLWLRPCCGVILQCTNRKEAFLSVSVGPYQFPSEVNTRTLS